MTLRYTASLSILAVLTLGLVAGCKSNTLMVTFPGATFVAEPPAGSQTTSQAPVVTPPATTTFEAGETYNWHVDVSPVTEITVNAVIVFIDTWTEGYLWVPVTPEQLGPDGFDIPSTFEQQEGQTVCNRDYRGLGTCYTELSTGTTDLGFAAANAPDPADPQGGAGLSWGEPVVAPMVVAEPDKGGDPTENCYPTSVGGCNLDTCCSATQCRYEVNGVKYQCNGTDCSNVVQAAMEACIAAAS